MTANPITAALDELEQARTREELIVNRGRELLEERHQLMQDLQSKSLQKQLLDIELDQIEEGKDQLQKLMQLANDFTESLEEFQRRMDTQCAKLIESVPAGMFKTVEVQNDLGRDHRANIGHILKVVKELVELKGTEVVNTRRELGLKLVDEVELLQQRERVAKTKLRALKRRHKELKQILDRKRQKPGPWSKTRTNVKAVELATAHKRGVKKPRLQC